MPNYDAAAVAVWRSQHAAGYAAQEPVLHVDNPFPSEVILHFYNPAGQQLFESYRVPAGGQLRGLRYQGKPFLPGSDWGVRLSKGGETSCTQFLGSLVRTDAAGNLTLKLDGFTRNGFLLGATAGVPRKPQPKADAPEEENEENETPPQKTGAPKERAYSIYVHNQNAFPIEVAYSLDPSGSGREEVHAWVTVPAGAKQLLFQSKVGAFCIRAEYTDASGARRGWGGDAEKLVKGEKKKFKCRVLGPTQWTYTAAFRGGQ